MSSILIVEAKARKIRIGKTKRVREEIRRKGAKERKREEKSKKREDNGSK